MPWIQSHTVLVRHRKVMLLSAVLNLKPVYVVGHLHALWHTVLEQQENGDLRAWPDEMIAHAAAYDGNPTDFVRHLSSCGFLDGKVIHDWWEYAGTYLTKKYHTSNPKKLQAIREFHEGLPQGSLKDASRGTSRKRKPRGGESSSNPISERSDKTRSDPKEEKDGKDKKATAPVVSITGGVWQAYSAAYQERYGHKPVSNAKVFGQLANLIRRIGEEEAPHVAAFYVNHPNSLYVRSGHCVDLLLRDCEKIRTEWVSGRHITARAAQEEDRFAAGGEAVRNVTATLLEKQKGE